MSDVFYSCEDVDELTHTEPDEAINAYLDGLGPEHWPKTLTVMVYTRKKIEVKERMAFSANALEALIEWIDEEHGNPDEATEHTQKMRYAAELFVNTVLEEYTVWTCEHHPKDDIEVNTADWVRKNCAHWLKEEETE